MSASLHPATDALLRYLQAGACSAADLQQALGMGSQEVHMRLQPQLIAGKVRRIGSGRRAIYEWLEPAATSRGLRTCLGCQKPFHSDGPHNRLCPTCRRHANEASPYAT